MIHFKQNSAVFWVKIDIFRRFFAKIFKKSKQIAKVDMYSSFG
jgi:hypothetical protein